MDDDKKPIQTPISGSVSRELETARTEVSNFIEKSEPDIEISPEVSEFVKPSEVPIIHKDIIKASGEAVPVSTAPSGNVQLPEPSKRQKALQDLRLGSTAGEAWEGEIVVREEDRVQLDVLKSKLKELNEKAA